MRSAAEYAIEAEQSLEQLRRDGGTSPTEYPRTRAIVLSNLAVAAAMSAGDAVLVEEASRLPEDLPAGELKEERF